MPCLRWALFYFFPHISRFLGYGRIVDKFAPIPPPHANPSAAPVVVNCYSFFSCPFCPIVLARLQALQKQMGFTLETFDVTLKPRMLWLTKGIRSDIQGVQLARESRSGCSGTVVTCPRRRYRSASHCSTTEMEPSPPKM